MRSVKTYFFLLAFSPVANTCIAQKIIVRAFMVNKKAPLQSDTIYYDFGRTLQWADFKGKPVDNYFAGAVTASGFAFDSQINFDGKDIYLNIGIYTFFTKHDSWKKPGINSAYHLMHEQHHFDITRLGAQDFLDQVRQAHFTKQNYSALLSSLFDKAYKENTDLQHEYDKETNHSIDTGRQLEWNNKIAAEILRLKEGVVLQ